MLLSHYHLVRIASNNFISISYRKFLFNLITSSKFNWCVLLLRRTISRQRNLLIVVCRMMQVPVYTGIQSLQTSIEIKLCQNPWNGLYIFADYSVFSLTWTQCGNSTTELTCTLNLICKGRTIIFYRGGGVTICGTCRQFFSKE